MSIESLKNLLPESAKDIRLNLSTILTEEGAPDLSLNQLYGVALACAFSIGNRELVETIKIMGKKSLSEAEIKAAESAAMIMGMNNVYYRFIHLVQDKAYSSMPAKLRMNVIGKPGIDHLDFELYCLAVSALNGCGLCMDSHVKNLEKAGCSKEAIQSSVRIASVLAGVACGLSIH